MSKNEKQQFVTLKMPDGGDEKINPKAVLVIRDPTDIERDETPEVASCIWGKGFRLYPAETVSQLVAKLPSLKLARLTTPGGMFTLVNAEAVTDRDDPSRLNDHVNTRSVLIFGADSTAPRVRVRETLADLERIWRNMGVPTDPFQ